MSEKFLEAVCLKMGKSEHCFALSNMEVMELPTKDVEGYIYISRWCTLLKIEAFCVWTLYSRSLLQPAANLPGGGLCHAGDVSTWPSLGWLIRNPTVCLAWITNHHLGGECGSQWIAQYWRIFGILTGHFFCKYGNGKNMFGQWFLSLSHPTCWVRWCPLMPFRYERGDWNNTLMPITEFNRVQGISSFIFAGIFQLFGIRICFVTCCAESSK